jgi:hypothetical protein
VLAIEAANLGARDVIVEAGWATTQLHKDGMPYSSEQPSHPSVKVYVRASKGELVFPSTRWKTAEWNLAAVARTLEALRRIDGWGVTAGAEQYSGWKRLPAVGPQGMTREQAADVIAELATRVGIEAPARDLLGSFAFAKMAHRGISKQLHPDTPGGDADAMRRLNEALAALEGGA